MKLILSPDHTATYCCGRLLLSSHSGDMAWEPSEIAGNGDLLHLLALCAEPVEEFVLAQLLPGATGIASHDAAILIDLLKEKAILVPAQGQSPAIAERRKKWTGEGWGTAFQYHCHTNNIPKSDYSADPKGKADKALMAGYLERETPPALYKKYSGSSQPLSRPEQKRQPHAGLHASLARSVMPAGSEAALTREAFNWWLYLSFGQTAVRKLPLTGAHIARTSPSGGSRHPIEAYVFIQDLEGMEPGLYHYNVASHGLDPLKQRSSMDEIRSHITGSRKRPAFEPSVLVLLTAMFDRSMFRYRESRSYRVMHYDLGHLLQTSSLLASSLGIQSYRGYSPADKSSEAFLGIHTLKESVLGYIALK